ncbi:MAG: hypothetical protein ACPGOY_17370 [Rhodospirillaceae bacterium]
MSAIFDTVFGFYTDAVTYSTSAGAVSGSTNAGATAQASDFVAFDIANFNNTTYEAILKYAASQWGDSVTATIDTTSIASSLITFHRNIHQVYSSITGVESITAKNLKNLSDTHIGTSVNDFFDNSQKHLYRRQPDV